MDILGLLTKSLPDLVLSLIPGGGTVAAIARAVTGAMTDDEAARKVEADPQLRLELERALLVAACEKAKAEAERIRAENEVLLATNETMRAESMSEHWLQYAWRPLWGLASAAAFVVVCIVVGYLGWRAIIGGHPDALRMIPDLLSGFALLFGAPLAILGVASWHRGQEKRIRAAGSGSVAGTVAGGLIDTAMPIAGNLFKARMGGGGE